MHRLGGFFAEPRPFLPADHVTTDAGTGLVHMAPDHGEEDFLVCKAAGIDPVFAVTDDGRYREDWLWLGGQGSVINAKFNAPDGPICTDLREAGGLLVGQRRFQALLSAQLALQGQGHLPLHAAMVHPDGPGRAEPARDRAQGDRRHPLGAREIEEPDARDGRGPAGLGAQPPARLGRADRALPQPEDRRLSQGPGRQQPHPPRLPRGRRRRLVRRRPSGAARQRLQPRRLRAGHRHPRRLVRFGLDPRLRDRGPLRRGRPRRPLLRRLGPASRLVPVVPCSKAAPPAAAPRSRRCSPTASRSTRTGARCRRAIGNTVDPLAIIRDSGADILRLWVASTDYFEDVRIGKEILAGTSDAYRKLRNTFRYLLGALDGFSAGEVVRARRHARARALGAAPPRRRSTPNCARRPRASTSTATRG